MKMMVVDVFVCCFYNNLKEHSSRQSKYFVLLSIDVSFPVYAQFASHSFNDKNKWQMQLDEEATETT